MFGKHKDWFSSKMVLYKKEIEFGKTNYTGWDLSINALRKLAQEYNFGELLQ